MKRFLQGVPSAALAFGVLLAAAIAPGASAEARDLARALERIDSGSTIRVHVAGGGEFIGRYAGVSGDTLVVTGERAEHRLPTIRVAALWKQRTASLRGLETGGGIGLGVGLIAGLVATAISGWDFCIFSPCEGNPAEWEYTLYGAAGGALLGSVIGLSIGSETQDWLLLYKAPDYREAMFSSGVDEGSAPGCPCGSTLSGASLAASAADTGRLRRERLSLKITPDADGRLMLEATLSL